MSTPTDHGPTYIIIVAIAIVGMIGAMDIFTHDSNPNMTMIVIAITTLANLAYGVHVTTTKAQSTPTSSPPSPPSPAP